MFGHFPFPSIWFPSIHDRRKVLYGKFPANKAERIKYHFAVSNEKMSAGDNCQWILKQLIKWVRVNFIMNG